MATVCPSGTENLGRPAGDLRLLQSWWPFLIRAVHFLEDNFKTSQWVVCVLSLFFFNQYPLPLEIQRNQGYLHLHQWSHTSCGPWMGNSKSTCQRICSKRKFSGPTPALQNQTSGLGPSNLCFNKITLIQCKVTVTVLNGEQLNVVILRYSQL